MRRSRELEQLATWWWWMIAAAGLAALLIENPARRCPELRALMMYATEG